MYSPQLLDHFEHPRNAGVLPNPDVTVQVENPACGDVLKLSASLSQGRIAQIRFQAQGCVPCIASGSALTEIVMGKTLPTASAVRREDLLSHLGGVPAASVHASHLAMDALQELLLQLRAVNSLRWPPPSGLSAPAKLR